MLWTNTVIQHFIMQLGEVLSWNYMKSHVTILTPIHIRNNPTISIYRHVCVTGRVNISRRLIESGADINAVDSDNNSALIFALTYGNHTCEVFTENGDLNDWPQIYPLGNDDVAELLIQSGANVDIVSRNGKSALTSAAGQGKKNVFFYTSFEWIDWDAAFGHIRAIFGLFQWIPWIVQKCS